MKYIRMNNNDNRLSLGNLFNIIKDISKNKSSAIQTEVFCILMDIDNITESTVNNYATGYRSINSIYKQIYINYRKNYSSNKLILINVINNILSIIDGIIYNYKDYDINNLDSIQVLCNKLHILVKNDINVSNKFKKDILEYINNSNYIECLSNILFYIIIDNKQPLYEEEEIKSTIIDIVKNTNLGIDDLRDYLNIQFKEGINLVTSLKRLAKKNNPYALNELGNMEYKGYIYGYPRYEEAYKYYIDASNYEHPTASFMIAHMIINKKIGNRTEDELELAWKYLNKAINSDSVSAINTMGLCYLNGYYVKKDKDMAIKYFNDAKDKGYIYAYNNLGKIYEEDSNYKEAFICYMESAKDEESWACNKIGEFYRKGLYVEKDMKEAYKYYLLGSRSPIQTRYVFNNINLVRYFYLNGNALANIEKNIDEAIKILESIKNNDLVNELLLYSYYDKYLEDNKYIDKVKEYLELVNNIMDEDKKKKIQDNIKNLDYKVSI